MSPEAIERAVEAKTLPKDWRQTPHNRLIQILSSAAETAGIPEGRIYQPIYPLQSLEREYLSHIMLHSDEGIFGAWFDRRCKDHELRMQLMCGWMVRHFLDARMRTSRRLVADMTREGEYPYFRVLLIPNLFSRLSQEGKGAGWHLDVMYEILLFRQSKGLQTIFYMSDISSVYEHHDTLARMLDGPSWKRFSDSGNPVQVSTGKPSVSLKPAVIAADAIDDSDWSD